jgi:hypothetical protein
LQLLLFGRTLASLAATHAKNAGTAAQNPFSSGLAKQNPLTRRSTILSAIKNRGELYVSWIEAATVTLDSRAIAKAFQLRFPPGAFRIATLNLHTLQQSAAGSADPFQRGSPYFKRSNAPSG